MAIDNELGRRWSSTPDKYRYENASFVEDTREYNSLEVDCESRAKNNRKRTHRIHKTRDVVSFT